MTSQRSTAQPLHTSKPDQAVESGRKGLGNPRVTQLSDFWLVGYRQHVDLAITWAVLTK